MSMDLDTPVPMAPSFDAPRVSATILCHTCGAPIDGGNSINAQCFDCLKTENDITKSIHREGFLHYCRDCDRWLQPPQTWIAAAPESRELLALCLKKLPGLQRIRIVDASFIWTEPHSRRVKVKLTVQDAIGDAIMQQSFEVVYTVAYKQCPECAKSYTANVWRACVQVRQKVIHKRTFLHLEQLILSHGAHRDTININEAKDGIDFFFSQRNHGEKFVDFLKSVAPVNVKNAKELISQDTHTSAKSYKFTFSVEIVPVCKDDLVALPIKLAKQMGNISPIVLTYRVGTSVNFLDCDTLQTADISSPVYWRSPFVSLADSQELVEFIVLDIEPIGPLQNKWQLAEAQVARASDLGVNDKTYQIRTHLGNRLRAGDTALGYMLTGTNFNSDTFDAIEESNTYSSRIPDVVLVKRVPNRRRHRRRQWKVKRMGVDQGELLPKKADQERMDREFEQFLRDLEEDNEYRQGVQLYKKPKGAPNPDEMSIAESDDEGSVAGVDMNELLEDFDELTVEDH